MYRYSTAIAYALFASAALEVGVSSPAAEETAGFPSLPQTLLNYTPPQLQANPATRCMIGKHRLDLLSVCPDCGTAAAAISSASGAGCRHGTYHLSNDSVVAYTETGSRFHSKSIQMPHYSCSSIASTQRSISVSDRGAAHAIESEIETSSVPLRVGIVVDPVLASDEDLKWLADTPDGHTFLWVVLAAEMHRVLASLLPERGLGTEAQPRITVRAAHGQPSTTVLKSRHEIGAWLASSGAEASVVDSTSQQLGGQPAHKAASPSFALSAALVFACASTTDQSLLQQALELVLPGQTQSIHSPCMTFAAAASDAASNCSQPACTKGTLIQLAPARLPIVSATRQLHGGMDSAAGHTGHHGTRACAHRSETWVAMSHHVRQLRGIVDSVPEAIATWPRGRPGFPVGDDLLVVFHVENLAGRDPEQLQLRVDALHEMTAYRKTTMKLVVADLSVEPSVYDLFVPSSVDIVVAWGQLPLEAAVALPIWGGVFKVHDTDPEHIDHVRILCGILGRAFAQFSPAVRQTGAAGKPGVLRVAKLQSGFGDIVQMVQQRRRDWAQDHAVDM